MVIVLSHSDFSVILNECFAEVLSLMVNLKYQTKSLFSQV